MMIIDAVSIAAPVFKLARSAQKTGTTHSVFEHAVNFLFEGQLITLTDVRGGNLPYGICCELENLHLKNFFQPGVEFVLSEDGLCFAKEDLRVQWGAAAIWQPAGPERLDSRSFETAFGRLVLWLCSLKGELANLVHIRWLADNLDPFFDRVAISGNGWVMRFAEQVQQLTQATVQANWPAAEKSALGIMGLGIGLTPTGDDFLAGFLTAGLALGPREPFERITQAVAQYAPARTTRVSAALFQALSQDQLTERFGSLLEAMRNNQSNLEEKAAHMAAFGSSSGVETMYGFLYGARATKKTGEIKPLKETVC